MKSITASERFVTSRIFATAARVHVIQLTVVSCQYEAGTDLGDGYMYARKNSYNAYIVKGHIVVVDTNVVTAAVRGEFIVGRREEPERYVEFSSEEVSRSFGYFVFDKSTGSLIEGLSHEQFVELIKKEGWEPL